MSSVIHYPWPMKPDDYTGYKIKSYPDWLVQLHVPTVTDPADHTRVIRPGSGQTELIGLINQTRLTSSVISVYWPY